MREIMRVFVNNWVVALTIIFVVFALPFVAYKLFPNNRIIKSIRQLFKVVLTGWINIVVIFIAVYLSGFISAVVQDKATLNEALIGTLIGVVGYGIMFWIGFILLIILLDVLLFGINKTPQHINYKLAAEWLSISSPFIYWLLKYGEWIFLVAVLAFLVGQLLRKPRIYKILQLK